MWHTNVCEMYFHVNQVFRRKGKWRAGTHLGETTEATSRTCSSPQRHIEASAPNFRNYWPFLKAESLFVQCAGRECIAQ